jgi:hypothetical protein
MPSCSTANSALKYTLASGWSCGTTYALTTGALAQFAATTSAQLAGVVSDETGSGSLVFGTSPTISSPTISGGTVNNASVGATTPSTGKFTTLQATSTITPLSTAGIVGTVTNDSANAGSVGEYVSNTASGVALTTATTANVTSISLTAGDWDVTGAVAFVNTGGTTSISAQIAGISLTSATFTPIPSGFGQASLQNTAAVIPGSNMSLMPTRISVATTTTVYLIAQSTFTVSTMTANGFIRARRVR